MASFCCESECYSAPGEFDRFFNSEAAIALRRDLANGVRADHCKACWAREDMGSNSPRLDVLRWTTIRDGTDGLLRMVEESRARGFVVDRPRQLDLKFGTTCNLHCRMCSAYNSSKIWTEYERNREALISEEGLYEGARPYYEGPDHTPPLDKLMEMSRDIDRMNISGGEPMLLKRVKEYFRALKEADKLKNIRITFNSNATVIDEEVLELLREFRAVEFYISIDGYGKLYEYIRYPAKWDVVAANTLRIRDYFRDKKNSFVCVSPTYQALNILHLHELIEWCDQNKVEWQMSGSVYDPFPQRVHALPPEIREIAAQRLEGVLRSGERDEYRIRGVTAAIRHLRTPGDHKPEDVEKFVAYNRMYDRIRKQDFASACPELFQLIEDYKCRKNADSPIST